MFFLHLQKLLVTRFASVLLIINKTGLVEPVLQVHPNLNGSNTSGLGSNSNTKYMFETQHEELGIVAHHQLGIKLPNIYVLHYKHVPSEHLNCRIRYLLYIGLHIFWFLEL